MGTQVDIDQIGMPTPYAWEITNLEARNPADGKSTMITKLTFSSPSGVFTVFMSGDDAQQLAAQLRSKGKMAAVGLLMPEHETSVGSSGIRDAFRPTGPTTPSSGRTTDVSG